MMNREKMYHRVGGDLHRHCYDCGKRIDPSTSKEIDDIFGYCEICYKQIIKKIISKGMAIPIEG